MKYDEIRTKVNELNRCAIDIVDTITTLERATIGGIELTIDQIAGLKNTVKSLGGDLKGIAGEIKELVK